VTSPNPLALLMLADGRLPVGGYTQSGGLEPALHAGLAPAQVPDFVATRLRTVVTVDAATAVVARHRVAAGMGLEPVQAAWAARTPSEVTRAASTAVGRGCRRLLERLWPGSDAAAAVAALEAPARPVALGAMGAAAALSPAQVALLVCHDDVQSVCAAALKLLPLDPADTSAWLLGASTLVDQVVASVAPLTEPDGIPAPAAPLMEAWQHAHARQPRRLFSA
jgi:urease accessory protein